MRTFAGAAFQEARHRLRVDERAPDIKPLGVGITLLPHAMREFSALGIGDALTAAGIENRESCFYNRFGQFIHREHPPDFINIKVEEPVGDKPFDDLDKFISQDELRALSQNYKRIAGFALTDGGLGRGRKAGGGRRPA